MTIERVGFPDPVSKANKTERPARAEKNQSVDSITVSAGAREKAEIYQATEVAKASPDLRMDRIEEVKRKLQDPNYISEVVIEELANRLMEYYDLG